MACLLRDEVCTGAPEVLVCDPCLSALTGALTEVPALLRLLNAETGHSLARPLADMPNRGTPEAGVPVRVHMIDLSARLVEAIADWSAITGYPPAYTLPGMASACARLAAAPYRHLAALGGVASARATLRATRAARRALAPLLGVRRLPEPCPECGIKGLAQLTRQSPAVCSYCALETAAPPIRTYATPLVLRHMSDQNDMNHDVYVENTILGEVEGELTQTGNIGEDTPKGGVRNTISGKVSGTVIQAGNISGFLHL